MTWLFGTFAIFILYTIWLITAIFLLYIFLWLMLASRRKPTKDKEWRDYQTIEARMSVADDGTISMSDVHDWKYEVGKDPQEHYKELTFKISDIEKMYFIIVPFKWRPLAHTFLMFTLENGESVGLSVEARYSGGKNRFWWSNGLFRKHELYYRWGTEGDLIGRRTIYLNYALYKYPLKISQDFIERLFTVLAEESERLYETPRFYNTLMTNCFTEIIRMMFSVDKKVLPSLALGHFFPGISDKMLIRMGLVDSDSQDIEDVRAKFKIDQIQR